MCKAWVGDWPPIFYVGKPEPPMLTSSTTPVKDRSPVKQLTVIIYDVTSGNDSKNSNGNNY